MADSPVLAVGIDAGSLRTRCMIVVLEGDRARLLGCGDVLSQGWRRGRIADQVAVSECVLASVREAEERAGVQVGSAVVGVGGTNVCCANSRGGCDMNFPRAIDQHDVDRAVHLASRVQLQQDEMLLHLFPQDFKVDGRGGHRNPRGVIGSHLEVYVHLVTASSQEHQAIVGAVNGAHVAVEETVFEPVAAAYAAGVPDERQEGTAIIDIGAHSTELAVYFGQALALSASLPICGDHFTKDVARQLLVSLEDAELMKHEYGCALARLTAGSTLVEVPSAAGRGSRETTRRELNEVLEARALELFEFVEHELAKAGMEKSMTDVVLTGGGARLHGMCDAAEEVLHCQARIGLPVGLVDWPESVSDPSWTTVAGLAMYAARLKLRAQNNQKRGSIWNRMLGG